MQTIARVPGVSQAHELRLALEADGIAAVVLGEGDVGYVAGPVAVAILDERDAERARAVVARLEASTPPAGEEMVRRCPRCGTESPANFTACWRCRADLSDIEPVRPEPAQEPAAAAAPIADQPIRGRERRLLTLELAIVLLITFAPLPWQVWRDLTQSSVPPNLAQPVPLQLTYALQHIASTALLLFLLWERAGSLEPAGLAHLTWWKELLYGAAVLAATVAVSYAAGFVVHALGLPQWGRDLTHQSTHPGPVYPVVLTVAALNEEALFRAYFITRLRQLFASTGIAVGVSAILFALAHAESPARSLEILCFGLLYGGIFASVRRLPRLVLAHLAWNVLVIYGPP